MNSAGAGFFKEVAMEKPSKVKFLRGKCSSLLLWGKIARVNMRMGNKRTNNVPFVRGIELFCGITASIKALSWEHNQF
jgi:hypothetical protein